MVSIDLSGGPSSSSHLHYAPPSPASTLYTPQSALHAPPSSYFGHDSHQDKHPHSQHDDHDDHHHHESSSSSSSNSNHAHSHSHSHSHGHKHKKHSHSKHEVSLASVLRVMWRDPFGRSMTLYSLLLLASTIAQIVYGSIADSLGRPLPSLLPY